MPDELPGMSDHPRCLWMATAVPDGWSTRVFVAMCEGAAITGDPEDCNCSEREQEIWRLQRELGATRRRAAAAEAAAERLQQLQVRKLMAIGRYRRR